MSRSVSGATGTRTAPADGATPAPSAEAVARLTPIAIFLAAISAFLLTVVVWASSRGLDLTDEGLYLLDIRRGRANGTDFSQYHVILSWLFPAEPAVQALRLFRLIGDVTTAAALGATAAWFFTRKTTEGTEGQREPILGVLGAMPRERLAVWILVPVLFELLGWIWLPGSVSYNSLTAWLLNLQCILVLVALRSARGRWLALPMGLVLWLQVFVKWPSAVAMTGTVLAALAVAGPRARRTAFTLVATLVSLGAIMTVATPAGLDLGLLRQAGEFLEGAETHGIGGLIGQYFDDTVTTLSDLLGPAGLVVLLGLGGGLAAGRRGSIPATLVVTVWTVLVALSVPARESPVEGPVSMLALPYVVLFAILAVGVGRIVWEAVRVSDDQGRFTAVGGTLLLIVPLAAAVGTSNNPWGQMLTAAAPLGVLVVVVFADRWGSPLTVVPLVALIALQVLVGLVFRPYRQPALPEQTTAVLGLDVTLDADRAAFIEDLRRVTDPHLEGDERVFVAFSFPGLAVVLDAEVAGPSWTGNRDTAADRLCSAVAAVPTEFDEVGVVLLTEALAPEAEDCLVDAWPRFADLEPVAELSLPGTRPRQVKVLSVP